MSSIRHLSKVVFHQKSSSIKDRLPSKGVFHQRSSSIKVCPPSKVVFHPRSSFIKGCLPSKGVFHQRLFFIKGCLPSLVVLCLAIHCDLEGSRMFPYHLPHSKPLYKPIVTDRQAEKATYRGTSSRSAKKVTFNQHFPILVLVTHLAMASLFDTGLSVMVIFNRLDFIHCFLWFRHKPSWSWYLVGRFQHKAYNCFIHFSSSCIMHRHRA